MADVVYDFRGRSYLVTGASSGLGRQVALELAEAGARVLCVSRRRKELDEVAQRYPALLVPLAVDVTERGAMEEAIKSFVSQYGKFHGFVHCAGVLHLTALRTYATSEAQEIFATNFWAAIEIMRMLYKRERSVEGASYVLCSSTSAHTGGKGIFAYAAAKAAVDNAVKSLAAEMTPRRARLNSVCPGLMKSALTERYLPVMEGSKTQKVASVTDISGVILFLLSERAAWLNGTNIIVDGGGAL